MKLAILAMILLIGIATAQTITLPSAFQTKTENGITISTTPIQTTHYANRSEMTYYVKFPIVASKTSVTSSAFKTTGFSLSDFTFMPVSSKETKETMITEAYNRTETTSTMKSEEHNETTEELVGYNMPDCDGWVGMLKCWVVKTLTNQKEVYEDATRTWTEYWFETSEKEIEMPATYANLTTFTYDTSTAKKEVGTGEYLITITKANVQLNGKTILSGGSWNGTFAGLKIDPDTDVCGVLSSASTTYTLNQSVSINGLNCFNITAASVTLDCAGFSITGNQSNTTYGIYTNQTNTITKNCNVRNFTYGIGSNTGMVNLTIMDTNTSNNWKNGIYLAAGTTANLTRLSINETLLIFTEVSHFGIYSLATGTSITHSSVYGANAVRYGMASGTNTASNSTFVGNGGTTAGSCGSGGLCSAFYMDSATGSASLNNMTLNSTVGGMSVYCNSKINLTNSIMGNKYFGFDGANPGCAGGLVENITSTNAYYYTISCLNGGCARYVFRNINMTGQEIRLYAAADNITWDNIRTNRILLLGNNHTVTNCTVSSGLGSIFGITNSVVNNNTFTVSENSITGRGNSFIRNIFTYSGTATKLLVSGGNNTFYWNNLTSTTTGLYANDSNGTNQWNSSTEGNVWADVMNLSIAYTGTVASVGYSNLYIATAGAALPYNATRSKKVVGVQDWYPLTPTSGGAPPEPPANSCKYSGSYNWTINLSDWCNITSSQNIGANFIIYNGTGNVGYYNATNGITITTKGIVWNVFNSANEWIRSYVWFNITG